MRAETAEGATRPGRGPRSSRPRTGGIRPLCAAAAAAAAWVLHGAAAAQLPQGFREEVELSGLSKPTAVRFSPDGRVFVAEKRGMIQVFDDLDDPSPSVFADLRNQVHNYWDRGMIGLALDPGFPAVPYVYVLYTRDAPVGGAAPTWGDQCPTPPGPNDQGCVASGRLSRLTAQGGVAVGGEEVLIDDWCIQFVTHSVGTLLFGPDGALYVSGGEGAGYTFTDHGQRGNPCGDPPLEGGALRSQDIRTTGDPLSMHGTVIRVNPENGEALPDNPLYGGATAADDRIIAYGLRNPFRMAMHPQLGELWVGDVGNARYEEINRIPDPLDAVIENFGWPCYEGPDEQPGFDSANLPLCESLYGAPGAATDPYYSFRHGDPVAGACALGTSAISGLAFYGGGSYPAIYQGALFFSDYARRCMWVMLPGPDGLPDPGGIFPFHEAGVRPVDVQIGPGGDVFYVDIESGSVRRFEYFSSNQPPVALAAADVTSGPAPLTVHLDGTGSSDPDPGDALTYAWDLDGDSLFDDSSDPAPVHTFTASGNHLVGLRVVDPGGLADTDHLLVSVDNSPPQATILAPQGLTWRVDEEIAFAGEGYDPDEGPLPASALSWQVILHHCSPVDPTDCHEHFLDEFEGLADGTFFAPDHEVPSHLEVRLTVTEGGGGGGAGWWDPAWTNRRRLTFLNAAQGENLLGFPVLVRLDATRIDYGRTLPGGADLRFVDGDGTLLPHEVASWDSLGTSFVWVRVPQIDAGSNADFVWMYHGNDAAADAQDAAAVWAGHAAVWHLDGDALDAGGGGNHGSIQGAAAIGGAIDGALFFDGVNDAVGAGTSPALQIAGELTIQAWVQLSSLGLNRSSRILSKKSRWFGTQGYGLEINAALRRVTLIAGGNNFARAVGLPLTSGWHHVAAVVDGTQGRIYLDGVDFTSDAGLGALVAGAQALTLGRETSGGNHLFGSLDEVRVAAVARSADWIAAEVLSQGDAFVVFEEEESPLASSDTAVSQIFPETVEVTMETDPPGLQVAFYETIEPAPFTGEAIVGARFTVSAPTPQFLGGATYEFVSWSDGGAQTHEVTAPGAPSTLTATFGPPGPDPDPDWWDLAWGQRVELFLDETGLDEDLADVPVLVRLGPGSIDTAAAQPGGEDLRFVGEGDVVFPHELERYDPAGESLVWVRLPAVVREGGGGNGPMWLYYGNPAAPDGQDPPGVWDAGFRGVWHLDPQGGDSTSNGNDASDVGALADAGFVGTGRLLDGAGDHLDAGNSPALAVTGALTLEAWVRIADPGDTTAGRILSKKLRPTGPSGYSLVYQPSQDRLTVVGSGGNYGRAEGVALDTAWHYLAAVIEGSTARLFVDGVEVTDDGSVSPLYGNSLPLQMGRVTTRATGHFAGHLDEVRVSAVPRSAEWIELQHRSAVDALLTIGPQELSP